MTLPILNIDALDFRPWGHGVAIRGAGQAKGRYQARIALASRQLGAKKLGYNLTVLPPGKSAFPFHCHSVNEEVCEYPDSGRFGLLAEMPGAADGKPRELRFMGRAGESLEYWQGE